MNFNEIFSEFTFFGATISILFYTLGFEMQKKWKLPIFNPILIATIIIIGFLSIFHIDYEVYNESAKYLTYFITPATVCLAVPLYKQLQTLKKNLAAVLVSIFLGCVAHLIIIVGVAFLFHMDSSIIISFLPKSVTTPIAIGICDELGGIESLTIVGVMIAGIMGSVVGPAILKLFHIKEPVAQGLALGTASHAVGTSKAIELGEIQVAMSSLAICVTGIMTVIICPIVVQILENL